MLHVLSALLKERQEGNLHKLKDYLFFDTEKPAYNFVVTYVRKYNSLPDISTCRQHGYELPAVVETFDYYLDKSKDRFVRQLISEALVPDKINSLISSHPTQAIEVLDTLRRQADRVYKSKELTDIYSGSMDLELFLKDSMAGKTMGISTGSPALDSIIHGLKDSDLFILFARPGVGKTYLLLSIARAVLLQGKKALFINNEMSDLEIQQRFWGMMIGLNTDEMYNGNVLTHHFQAIQQRREEFKKIGSNLHVLNPIDPIDTAKLKDYIFDIKPDVLFVDSAYMLEPDPAKCKRSMSGIDKLNLVARDLRFIAKHLHIPTVAVAQANRESVSSKKMASTASIAGTDYWGQLASVMLHLENHDTDDDLLLGTLVKNRGGKSKIKGKAIQFLVNNNHKTMNFGVDSILGDTEDTVDESNERGEVSW